MAAGDTAVAERLFVHYPQRLYADQQYPDQTTDAGHRTGHAGQVMEQLINSSYDITAWYMSYQAIRQLEANSESYLRAVHASAGRIHLIVERIRQIEATPLCGKPPAVAPESAPPPPPVVPPAPATP